MPGTNTVSGVPIPLDTDPVRDGAKAVRDVANFVPYFWSSGQLFGAYQAAKPYLIFTARVIQISNQYAQLYVAFPKTLTQVSGAWIITQGTAQQGLVYDIDMTNAPNGTGMIFRVMSPDGTLLPNRGCDVSVLVIGQ